MTKRELEVISEAGKALQKSNDDSGSWKVTIHYADGSLHVDKYSSMNALIIWSSQAIRQMGWTTDTVVKVEIEGAD
jgi:hypothetical protein